MAAIIAHAGSAGQAEFAVFIAVFRQQRAEQREAGLHRRIFPGKRNLKAAICLEIRTGRKQVVSICRFMQYLFSSKGGFACRITEKCGHPVIMMSL